MKIRIVHDGKVYMLKNEQDQWWMGPTLNTWEAGPAGQVPGWMTPRLEQAQAQSMLLELGLSPYPGSATDNPVKLFQELAQEIARIAETDYASVELSVTLSNAGFTYEWRGYADKRCWTKPKASLEEMLELVRREFGPSEKWEKIAAMKQELERLQHECQ